MNTFIVRILAIATVTASTFSIAAVITTFAAPTYASIAHEIQAAVTSNGNSKGQSRGGTVILTGLVEDIHTRQSAVATKK